MGTGLEIRNSPEVGRFVKLGHDNTEESGMNNVKYAKHWKAKLIITIVAGLIYACLYLYFTHSFH